VKLTALNSVRSEAAHAAVNRGAETRARLIEAAIEVFGLYGFEGASTRTLAERAGVNLAGIPYYFRGKEGLYRAAAQYIVDRFGERLAPVTRAIDHALAERELAPREALRLLHELLNAFAALVIGSDEADRWCAFIMREQTHPGPAFEILYRGIMSKINHQCAVLLGRLLGRPQDDPLITIRVTAIVGQVLIFRISRFAVMKRLRVKRFSDELVQQIQAVLSEHLDSIVARART
jgi:TetR/AcrR family transcriptional regulator, regulator of cefoperazone and chloramphenicol sensitivity